MVKNLSANAGDTGLIPGSRRYTEERNSHPLQGWGSLVGCHLWGRTESDMTDVTYQQQQPVFLPRKSHGQRNLASYSPWGCKESDAT